MDIHSSAFTRLIYIPPNHHLSDWVRQARHQGPVSQTIYIYICTVWRAMLFPRQSDTCSHNSAAVTKGRLLYRALPGKIIKKLHKIETFRVCPDWHTKGQTKRQQTTNKTDCWHVIKRHWDKKKWKWAKTQRRDSIQKCGQEAIHLVKTDVIWLQNAKRNWTPQFGSCSEHTPKTSMIPERLPMSFHITQQAIDGGTAMITAGRMRVRLTLSGRTNSRGWKSWVTPWLD